MITTAIITPALGLKFYTDSDIAAFARQRIVNLTENAASFPNLSPSTVELTEITEEYTNALESCGKDATRSDTNRKNVKRRELEKVVSLCALSCSQIADGDLSLYLLSGFSSKVQGSRITELDFPHNIRYKQGPFDGSVYVLFKNVKNARSYEINLAENNNSDSWNTFVSGTVSPVLITDLKPMTIYNIRCRAMGARNIKSAWSNVTQVKVI